MVSAVDQAKRARESSDQEVKAAYRKLSKKAHPDKGGREADQKRLNGAYEKWQKELEKHLTASYQELLAEEFSWN